MKIYTAAFLALSVLVYGNLYGQTTDNTPDQNLKYKHAIGACAGFTTGYGLAYRQTFKKFGAQIAFAPYHTNETDRYSAGLTFLYTLIESKTTNLFLYQGNHYYYNSQMTYIVTDPIQNTSYLQKHTDSYFNNGIGIGIEFVIAKRIGFNLMGGYAFYNNFEQVNFTGETGLFYKF